MSMQQNADIFVASFKSLKNESVQDTTKPGSIYNSL